MTDLYQAIYNQFRWHVPERFNIARECLIRWAQQADHCGRPAVIAHASEGQNLHQNGAIYSDIRPAGQLLTYLQLWEQASKLSHLLEQSGVRKGDRVAIVLPQRPETAVAYMAVLQMGAVAVPLSILFGPEALQYRLQDADALWALCDETAVETLRQVRNDCPALQGLICFCESSKAHKSEINALDEMQALSIRYPLCDTLAEDPAVLIYTSGTTGPPKGALIPHRALIGNLTGFVASQNWFGFDGQSNDQTLAVFWSPADWAWTGGLMDALLPTLYFGRPIVACKERFSPELAFDILSRHRITHTFLFPTALKAMMKAFPRPRQNFDLQLQAIMSAGESVGDAVYAYCEDQLGIKVNEMFGQTEINYIVGNCNRFWPSKPGSMGKAYPGHRVCVIDEMGQVCESGKIGEVAVHHLDIHGAPDPVFFLNYWKNPVATQKKTTIGPGGERWCRTGDLALADEDGYLWYQGRADDMFKAAGYRIGPSEVENCLVKHPDVQNAAVVPKPDSQRGAVVKAYVVLTVLRVAERGNLQAVGDAVALKKWEDDIKRALQAHVRGRLAPYEYPKEIEFIDQLPMTTTGKVLRRVLRLQEEARAKTGANQFSV